MSRLSLRLASDLTGTRSDLPALPPAEPLELGVRNTADRAELGVRRAEAGLGVARPPSPLSVSL